MDAARYARLYELVDEARALDEQRRAELLVRIRGEDRELGEEFAALCAHLEGGMAPAGRVTGDARALLVDEAIGAARKRLEGLAPDPAAAGWIPERVGPYRIVKSLGQGGMGVVYEAEQDSPRRRVALKMIHPTLGSDERLRRFKLEGEVLGRLHHPGIAQIYECGAFDLGRGAQPYFAMELVEGVDLVSHVGRAHLGVNEKLELVADIADAVQHAHERGVVHRDLKPDNVLVEASGQPKVLDFGVARASDTSMVLSTLVTQTGELVGTLAYMAPEQLSGQSGAITARVDVYALGVILYQLLAARLPHDIAGLPLTAAIHLLTHVEPPPLTHFDARLKGDVATIVAKAMEKDPARRYASAAALAADIRRHLQHLPIAARPASASYRARKMIRRNRGVVAGLAAVFVTLSAGLAGTLWQARASDANAERALRQAYSANMLLADGALGRAQLSAARADLDAAPVSLRGWEWRVLSARLDSSARTQRRDLPHAPAYGHHARLELIRAPDGESYWTVDSTPGRLTRRWSATSGELLSEFPHPDPQAAITRTTLSPDGNRVWMTSWQSDFRLQGLRWAEWDVATGRREDLPPPTGTIAVRDWRAAPSPEGSLWIVTQSDVTVWDGSRGEASTLLQETAVIDDVRFSRDGSRIVLLPGPDMPVLDTAKHELLTTVPENGSRVNGVDFSQDDRRLATAGNDANARVWDLTSRPATCVATLTHDKEVVTVAFSPEGVRLATLSIDRNIRVWDVASGALLETFGTETLCSTAIAFFAEREIAGLEIDGTLVTWDLDARATYVLEGHGNPLLGAVPLPRAGLIASGAWDGFHGRKGALRFWDAETGDPVAACIAVEEAVYALAAAPDGNTLAVSLARQPNRTPYLLLVHTGSGRTSRVPLPGTALSLAFDPTGLRVAIASPWAGTFVAPVDSRTAPIQIAPAARCVDWSHDGRLLAIGSRPESSEEGRGTALFDASSLSEVHRLATGRTITLAFSPDDRRLATAGDDALVRLWDVASGALVATLAGHDLEVYALAFSPDGQRLASAGLDQGIRLWDTRTFAPVGALSGHTDHVASLAWDGERLISSSGDDTVRIWEPQPVRTRLAAREARRAAVARVTPLVTRLLAEHGEPEEVLTALARETGLDDLERKVAHQLAFGAALERALK